MMSDHPFGPFAGTPGDPLNKDAPLKICCPKCKSENFRAFSNQFGVQRVCKDCRNTWSGGVGGVLAVPDSDHAGSSGSPLGVAAPDDTLPARQFVGPEIDFSDGGDY
jgi:hypothetical protein